MHLSSRLVLMAGVLTLIGAGCLAKTTVTTGNTNTTITTNISTNAPGTGTFTTGTTVANTNLSLAASMVSIIDEAFSPTSLTVKQGTTVTWTNNGQLTHTVNIAGNTSSGDLVHGQTFSHVFTAPGTYTYSCGHHSIMTGTITVTH